MRALLGVVLAAPAAEPGGSARGPSEGAELLISVDSGLATIHADGTGLRHVPHTHHGDEGGVWSPDGRQIAFVEAHSVRGNDVRVMRSDGSGRRRLTFSNAWDEYPSWARDGRIAFDSDRDGGTSNIYALDPSTGKVTQVTNDTVDDWNATFRPTAAASSTRAARSSSTSTSRRSRRSEPRSGSRPDAPGTATPGGRPTGRGSRSTAPAGTTTRL